MSPLRSSPLHVCPPSLLRYTWNCPAAVLNVAYVAYTTSGSIGSHCTDDTNPSRGREKSHVVVLVAVIAGAMLLRLGLQVFRTAEFPPTGASLIRPVSPAGAGTARAIGTVLAVTGFLLAAIPLAILSVVLWLLRDA